MSGYILTKLPTLKKYAENLPIKTKFCKNIGRYVIVNQSKFHEDLFNIFVTIFKVITENLSRKMQIPTKNEIILRKLSPSLFYRVYRGFRQA